MGSHGHKKDPWEVLLVEAQEADTGSGHARKVLNWDDDDFDLDPEARITVEGF